MATYYSVQISIPRETTRGRRYRRLAREFSTLEAAKKFYDEHAEDACYADLVEFNGMAGRFLRLKALGQ